MHDVLWGDTDVSKQQRSPVDLTGTAPDDASILFALLLRHILIKLVIYRADLRLKLRVAVLGATTVSDDAPDPLGRPAALPLTVPLLVI